MAELEIEKILILNENIAKRLQTNETVKQIKKMIEMI